MLLSSGLKQFKTIEKVLPKFNEIDSCFQLNYEEATELMDLITYIIESNPEESYINSFDKTILKSAYNKIQNNSRVLIIYNKLEIIRVRKILIDYLRFVDESII